MIMEETKNEFPRDLKVYLMTLGACLTSSIIALIVIMFFKFDLNLVFYLPFLYLLVLAYFGIFRQIGGLYSAIRGRDAKILGFIYLSLALVYMYYLKLTAGIGI